VEEDFLNFSVKGRDYTTMQPTI